MRLDRFLGNVQMVLWEPRYLIKDNVTEWSTAVQELRRYSEVRSRERSLKTYKFDSLWRLLAKGREGCNPMLCEDLHFHENPPMRASAIVHLYATGSSRLFNNQGQE